MISSSFDYARATSLDDAIKRLGAAGGAAKLVAGGHSLVPLMKLRLSEPQALIDIARIKALSNISELDGHIEIGATAVHHAVATSKLLRRQCPGVADAAGEIGDPQVRNRGTLGGSLAHADPAADYPAVMLAVDAEIHLKGPKGWRMVRADGFFQGLFTVDLAPDEIIAGVRFAPAPVSAYAKLRQRASHYAIVGVAAALQVNDGTIQSARVGLTGAGAHAVRLSSVERALAGQPLTDAVIASAAGHAGAEVTHLNADIHASEDYRRAMIPVFTRRALEGAMRRA
ncbi:MAG: xanthine dehydrogenase family protein subunit M [Acidobacteria bacterium]|nr:xanthine dehydrogenase family protein subunit M [Acidobacteriota bacterium]MQC48307.1 xanthine dehydrogenase family protein subunit M [Chloroflexota bacterium]